MNEQDDKRTSAKNQKIFEVQSVLLTRGVPNVGTATLLDEEATLHILASRDAERIKELSRAKLTNAPVVIGARFVPTPLRNVFLIVGVESIEVLTEEEENAHNEQEGLQ